MFEGTVSGLALLPYLAVVQSVVPRGQDIRYVALTLAAIEPYSWLPSEERRILLRWR